MLRLILSMSIVYLYPIYMLLITEMYCVRFSPGFILSSHASCLFYKLFSTVGHSAPSSIQFLHGKTRAANDQVYEYKYTQHNTIRSRGLNGYVIVHVQLN